MQEFASAHRLRRRDRQRARAGQGGRRVEDDHAQHCRVHDAARFASMRAAPVPCTSSSSTTSSGRGCTTHWRWIANLASQGVFVDVVSAYGTQDMPSMASYYPRGNSATNTQRAKLWELASYYLVAARERRQERRRSAGELLVGAVFHDLDEGAGGQHRPADRLACRSCPGDRSARTAICDLCTRFRARPHHAADAAGLGLAELHGCQRRSRSPCRLASAGSRSTPTARCRARSAPSACATARPRSCCGVARCSRRMLAWRWSRCHVAPPPQRVAGLRLGARHRWHPIR